jgi:hypothetical protein
MRTFKAASSTNNVHSVAIICDRVNARERTHLKPVRGRILRKYGVASLSHPMMMHFCDNSIRSRCDAEDVDANPSCEITGCGPKSCVYKLLAASGTETASWSGVSGPVELLIFA